MGIDRPVGQAEEGGAGDSQGAYPDEPEGPFPSPPNDLRDTEIQHGDFHVKMKWLYAEVQEINEAAPMQSQSQREREAHQTLTKNLSRMSREIGPDAPIDQPRLWDVLKKLIGRLGERDEAIQRAGEKEIAEQAVMDVMTGRSREKLLLTRQLFVRTLARDRRPYGQSWTAHDGTGGNYQEAHHARAPSASQTM